MSLARFSRLALPLSLFALVAIVPQAQAQVSTTFDTDLDGWVVVGDNTHFWNPTGGNPDGCLEVPDNASGPWSTATAPIKFLGNWRDMTPSDSVSYDVLFLPVVGSSGNPPAVFIISGPGGTAVYDETIADSVWVHISAPIDSSFWSVQSGTWSGILQRVTNFEVAVEYKSGDETVLVDNIELTGTPTSTFQPCDASDFELNATGWGTDGTANSSRQTSDGDIGGYLRVVANSGVGRVIVPPYYGGDWSSLDVTGSIGFSFAYDSGTIVAGREMRLELSGPGGSAYVTRPSDDFLDRERAWLVQQWPLDAGSWTVDSGSWAGLLADVQEVAITVDFATGSDTYGIDNFFRYGTGCDPIPELPLTFYEGGYSLCDRYAFRDGAALALNPTDGELYGIVNAGTSITNGGGVYRLSGGAGRGVRIHTYSAPEGLVFTSDGDGFVTEDGSGDLHRFVGVDSSMIWIDGGSGFQGGDDDVAGLGIAPPGFSGANVSPGDLLVTDWGNGNDDLVWAVSPDTMNGERLLVPDPGSANFWDIVGTPAGDVYLCDDSEDNALWSVGSDGTLTSFPIDMTIVNMEALAYDSEANAMYTMRTSNPVGLYRINMGDGSVTLIADGFDQALRGNLEIDAANRKLYVSDNGDNQIYTICLPSVVAVGDRGLTPGRLSLTMRPNPTTGEASLRFRLPQASPVTVDVIDLAGRRVRTIQRGTLGAGEHALRWDGRDDAGRQLSTGVYFVRVKSGEISETLRAVLVR